jgi:hypothetical protein
LLFATSLKSSVDTDILCLLDNTFDLVQDVQRLYHHFVCCCCQNWPVESKSIGNYLVLWNIFYFKGFQCSSWIWQICVTVIIFVLLHHCVFLQVNYLDCIYGTKCRTHSTKHKIYFFKSLMQRRVMPLSKIEGLLESTWWILRICLSQSSSGL